MKGYPTPVEHVSGVCRARFEAYESQIDALAAALRALRDAVLKDEDAIREVAYVDDALELADAALAAVEPRAYEWALPEL